MIEKILGLFTNYPDKTGKDLSAENLNEITYTINALIDMILPMFEKLGLISDWVVESGSNANGSWEKWNSGKLVQWGKGTLLTGLEVTDPWGTGLFTSGINSIPSVKFPIPFVEPPSLARSFVKSEGGNFFLMESRNILTTHQTGSFELVRGSATSPISGYLTWQAIGRWK